MQESATRLAELLAQQVGAANVVADAADRAFYGTDVYEAGVPPALVVRPETTEQLANVVRLATEAGFSVIARGGGASYTGGYLPANARTVTLDMGRMNRIVEINRDDMYVTVEAGVTWAQLWEALKGTGLRTPMWGTLSGLQATIGGGLSQNSIFFGTGTHGITADMVLGLQIVLADGTVLSTGSAAVEGAKPFFRWYGPDLTGLFLGDTGALGVKATATLKLIPAPTELLYASFAFESYPGMYEAMAEIARQQLAAECFGFDPGLQRQRLRRAHLAQDLKALKGVVTGQGSLLKGVAEAAKVAVAGRRFMEDVLWSAHFTIEGRDAGAVKRQAEALHEICRRFGGREIENTIPKVTRGTPFTPLTSMLGPDGERWVPVHGIMPLSAASKVQAALDLLWEANRAEMERLRVAYGELVCTIATNGFLIEPVFYWEGPRLASHERMLAPDFIAKLKDFSDHPEAAALVRRLRHEIAELFRAHGATHFQIGKHYPYRTGLQPDAFRVIEAIKSVLDPQRAINPGSLGLG